VGFLLLALLIWQFDFSPFMVLIVAILNDGVSSTKHGFYDSFKYTDILYPNVELLVLSLVPNFFLFFPCTDGLHMHTSL
jgi:hypothetical protein